MGLGKKNLVWKIFGQVVLNSESNWLNHHNHSFLLFPNSLKVKITQPISRIFSTVQTLSRMSSFLFLFFFFFFIHFFTHFFLDNLRFFLQRSTRLLFFINSQLHTHIQFISHVYTISTINSQVIIQFRVGSSLIWLGVYFVELQDKAFRLKHGFKQGISCKVGIRIEWLSENASIIFISCINDHVCSLDKE